MLTLLCGCERGRLEDSVEKSSLSISLSLKEIIAQTKAAPTVIEDAVSDINIFAYNAEGHLISSRFVRNPAMEVDLEVPVGQECSLYAIANVGDLTGVSQARTADGIVQMEWWMADSMTDSEGRPPLSGRIPAPVYAGEPVFLSLDRLLSKFRIILDTTSLDEDVSKFDVKRIGLKNLNRRVGYFHPGKAESEEDILPDGMYYEEAEIYPAFSAGLDFYLPENAQGDLLSDNIEEETHVPGSPYDGLCSYVEFVVDYRSRTQYNDSLIYRYYLHDGRQLDNFDVLRNTMYTCLTRFIGSGINENSWRIDISGMKDLVTGIQVSPEEYEFRQKEQTYKFEAFVQPLSAENKTVMWQTDNPDVATVQSDGTVRAVSDGECCLIATAADGSGVADTARVIVNTYVYTESVTVSPDDVLMFVGDRVALDAVVMPENSNDKGLTWVSTDPSVARVDASGVVEAVSEGSCMVVVSTNDADRKDTAMIKSFRKTFEMSLDHETLIPGYRSPVAVRYSANPETEPSFYLENLSGDAQGAEISEGKVYAYNPSGQQGEIGTYRLTGTAHGISRTVDFTVDAGMVRLNIPGGVYVGIPYRMTFSQLSPSDVGIEWYSADESVATVSSDGELLPLKSGRVKIKAVSATGAWDEVEVSVVNPQIGTSDITTYEGFQTELDALVSVTPDNGFAMGYEVLQGADYVRIQSDNKLYASKRNTSATRAVVKAFLKDYPAVSRTFRVLVKPAVQISYTGDNRIVNTSGHTSDGRYIGDLQRSLDLTLTLAPGESVYWSILKKDQGSQDLSVNENGRVSANSSKASGEYRIFAWNKSHSFRSDTVTVEVYQYLDYEVGISGISTYSPSGGLTEVKYYSLSLHARWSDDSWTWMGPDQRLFIGFKIVGYPETATDFYYIASYGSTSPTPFLKDFSTNVRVTNAGQRVDLQGFSPKSYLRGSFDDASVKSVMGSNGQYYKMTSANTGVSGLDGYYFIRQINDVFYNITSW